MDLFCRDPEAQIIHVTHDGLNATVNPVSGFLKHRNIFADLDVRASDLLQTNAIVWVEGPSDRIYFNRWIELWSNEVLKEHVDYECVTYGGALLTNFAFDSEACQAGEELEVEAEDEKDFIQAIRINPNAIVIMDSDRREIAGPLKDHVKRITQETATVGGYSWITQGREVENYAPWVALRTLVEASVEQAPGTYDDVFEFIKQNKGLVWSKRKPELAKRICKLLTKEMIEEHLDLARRLTEVCQKIHEWNDVRPPVPRDGVGSLAVDDQA